MHLKLIETVKITLKLFHIFYSVSSKIKVCLRHSIFQISPQSERIKQPLFDIIL